jgi:hypothetical protein
MLDANKASASELTNDMLGQHEDAEQLACSVTLLCVGDRIRDRGSITSSDTRHWPQERSGPYVDESASKGLFGIDLLVVHQYPDYRFVSHSSSAR